MNEDIKNILNFSGLRCFTMYPSNSNDWMLAGLMLEIAKEMAISLPVTSRYDLTIWCKKNREDIRLFSETVL